MFRELSHSTAALIAGKPEDADEDPEYLKVPFKDVCFEAISHSHERRSVDSRWLHCISSRMSQGP